MLMERQQRQPGQTAPISSCPRGLLITHLFFTFIHKRICRDNELRPLLTTQSVSNASYLVEICVLSCSSSWALLRVFCAKQRSHITSQTSFSSFLVQKMQPCSISPNWDACRSTAAHRFGLMRKMKLKHDAPHPRPYFLITTLCLCALQLFRAAFMQVTLPKVNSANLLLQKYSMSPGMIHTPANFPTFPI